MFNFFATVLYLMLCIGGLWGKSDFVNFIFIMCTLFVIIVSFQTDPFFVLKEMYNDLFSGIFSKIMGSIVLFMLCFFALIYSLSA